MHSRRHLTWPQNLKSTPIRDAWFAKFARLKPGLDLEQVSRELHVSYGAARRWATLFGYEFPDRRRRGVDPREWDHVDWSLRDAEIARRIGVSRECVRLIRRARAAGPSAPQAAAAQLSHFIAAHRDKLHGLLVEEVVHHSGTDLPYHVVRRLLREHGVQPHEPRSKLRDVDWRLPNRDLALIWGASARYLANVRARLGVGPARWTARARHAPVNPAYAEALAQERLKARQHRRHAHVHAVPAG